MPRKAVPSMAEITRGQARGTERLAVRAGEANPGEVGQALAQERPPSVQAVCRRIGEQHSPLSVGDYDGLRSVGDDGRQFGPLRL